MRKIWLAVMVGLVFFVTGVMLIFMNLHNGYGVVYIGRLLVATGFLLMWFVGFWLLATWLEKIREEYGPKRVIDFEKKDCVGGPGGI